MVTDQQIRRLVSMKKETLTQAADKSGMSEKTARKYLKANKEFVMSSQLLRSGTSIGANISEAQAAQSTNDFISKMSIASKEARETEYWLRLLDIRS